MDFIADIATLAAINAPAGFETAVFLSLVGVCLNAPVVLIFIAAKILDRRA